MKYARVHRTAGGSCENPINGAVGGKGGVRGNVTPQKYTSPVWYASVRMGFLPRRKVMRDIKAVKRLPLKVSNYQTHRPLGGARRLGKNSSADE